MRQVRQARQWYWITMDHGVGSSLLQQEWQEWQVYHEWSIGFINGIGEYDGLPNLDGVAKDYDNVILIHLLHFRNFKLFTDERITIIITVTTTIIIIVVW